MEGFPGYVTIFFLLNSVVFVASEPFAVYGGNDEIHVTRLNTGELVKKFVVSISPVKYVIFDYKENVIFAASERDLTRLHLVDEDGQTKRGEPGELLLNTTSNHIETVTGFNYYAKYDKITGLSLWPGVRKFFIATANYVYLSNYKPYYQPFTVLTYGYQFTNFRFAKFAHGILYFGKPGSAYVYRCIITPDRCEKDIGWFVKVGTGETDLSIDTKSNKLYWIEKNQFKVADISNTKSNPRIVLGDSAYTKGTCALTIHQNPSTGTSWLGWYKYDGEKSRVMKGDLNTKNNFIQKHDIIMASSDQPAAEFKPLSMEVFEHSWETTPDQMNSNNYDNIDYTRRDPEGIDIILRSFQRNPNSH